MAAAIVLLLCGGLVLEHGATFAPSDTSLASGRRTAAQCAERQRRRSVQDETGEAEIARTPSAFVAKLNLSALVEEEFDARIKSLQDTAAEMSHKREAEVNRLLEELAVEVAEEEQKAIDKMEATVGVLMDRVSFREGEVEKAVTEMRTAQRAVDDFNRSAALFTTFSLFGASALAAAVVYAFLNSDMLN